MKAKVNGQCIGKRVGSGIRTGSWSMSAPITRAETELCIDRQNVEGGRDSDCVATPIGYSS